MDVPENVYSWLRSTGVLQLPLAKGKFNLPQDIVDSLVIGLGFVPILKRMNQLKVTAKQSEDSETPSPISSLSTLKSLKTPSNLLHNWKILTEAFELFSVSVDQDLRTLIIAGDPKPLIEILKQLQESESSGFTLRKKPSQGLDINTIDEEKTLIDADSCLEFFILSFIHNFHLSTKQATGLLAQGCKYLAHIIAKGLKGDFEPVRNWLQDIYVNNDRLSALISREEDSGSAHFVLSALKPGVLSKDLEVVQWTFRVLSRVILDLSEKQMLAEVWKWFIDENLTEICVLSMKRIGNDVASHAIDFMIQVSQFSLVEFFTVHLRNAFSDSREYYEIICQVLDHSKESSSSLEELADSGVIAYWSEMAAKDSDFGYGKPRDSRASGLIFLGKIVSVFWSYFEMNESKMNNVLSLLNRTCRDDNKILKFLSIGVMFHLFELLTDYKSSFAPVIYRTLTFLLVETYNNSEIRQFIQDNFSIVFKKTENIPIGILVEPYIKRLQVNDLPLEIFDFEFLIVISQYPTLSLKQGIQIIDLLGKSYLNDLVYSKLSGVPFTYLASRFISQALMQDYLFVFSEYGLNLAVATESKKVKKGKKPPELEEALQQRNKVLDMVYWIIQQWQDSLNEKYKTLLLKLINDFKTANAAEFNGLIVLLDLLGDAQAIIQESRASQLADLLAGLQSTDPPAENIENYQLVPVIEAVTVRKVKPGSFPWERINDDIEKAKKRKQEKDKKLREEEEKVQKSLEIKKKKLKKQLEVRKLEQGVQRNGANSLVYKEGVVQKYITQEEVNLRLFSPEEADLEEAVTLMMSKYSRVFKLLFFKYSGTGFEKRNHAKTDFDLHAERKSKLNDAEFIKLLKDFSVIPKLMVKEELKAIMRTYNLKIAKQAEQWYVDYKSFKGVFLQVAFFVYSRRPHDYSHLPPVVSLKFLLDFMRETYRNQGKNTEIFDEPDPGTGDKDEVRSLNKALLKDPKTVIPEGYEKITDKEVSVYFSVPDAVGLSSSYRYAVEILDDVMFKTLGIRFLEPQIHQTLSYRVKGKPVKKEAKVQPPIYERVSETIRPKDKVELPGKKSQNFEAKMQEKVDKIDKKELERKETLEKKETLERKETKNLKDSKTLKEINTKDLPKNLQNDKKVAEKPQKNDSNKTSDKSPAKSTAVLRSELKQEPIKSNLSPEKTSKFAALTEKVESISRKDPDKSKTEEDRKRSLRQLELQEEIRKAKLARQQMLREEEEKRKNQNFLDELQKKVAEERLKKEKEEKKRMIEVWQKKKEEESKQKELEDHFKKRISDDVHKSEESRKRNMQRLMEELKNRESKTKKLKDEETLRLKQIIKGKEEKKKIGLQHYLENKAKESNQQKDNKKEFLILINNNEIKRFCERFADQIGDIFAFYLLKMGDELSSETSINASCFNKFCEDFSVFEITARDQCQGVFNFLTKRKSAPVINSEEFTKALVLIANLGKERLDVEDSGVKPVAKFFDYTDISLNVKDLKKKLNKFKEPNNKIKKRPLSLINASKQIISKKNLDGRAEENKVNRSYRRNSNSSERSNSSNERSKNSGERSEGSSNRSKGYISDD